MLEVPGCCGETSRDDEIGIQRAAQTRLPCFPYRRIYDQTAFLFRKGSHKNPCVHRDVTGRVVRGSAQLRKKLAGPRLPLLRGFFCCDYCDRGRTIHGKSAARSLCFADLVDIGPILDDFFFRFRDNVADRKGRGVHGEKGFLEFSGNGVDCDGYDGVAESAEGLVVEHNVVFLGQFGNAEAAEPRRSTGEHR